MEAVRPGLQFSSKLFESFNLEIEWLKSKTPLIYPVTAFCDPCVIQFALQTTFDLFHTTLERRKIHLANEHIRGANLKITIHTQLKSEQEVKDYVRDTLKEALERIDFMKINKAQSIVLQPEEERLSTFVNQGKLILLSGNEVVYVVGYHDIIKTLKKKLGLKYSEKCIPEDYNWSVLEGLNVDKYLKNSYPDVKVIYRDNHVLLTGSSFEVEKALKKIKDLLANICKETVFHSTCHRELLLDNGDENVNVLAFFRKVLVAKKLECHAEIDADENPPLVHIYGFEKSATEQSKQVISGCINDHTIAKDVAEKIQPFTSEWVGKKKMKIVEKSRLTVRLVCTSDISAKLHKELLNSDEIKLPSTISSYLGHHGRDDLMDLAKRNDVSIQHDEKHLTLRVSGTDEHIKTFRRSLKETYVGDIISLDIPKRSLIECEDELRKIADSDKCWFCPKFADHKEHHLKIVSRWQHVHSTGKVSLMLGHVDELHTDCRIVFITDKLCFLHKDPQEKKDPSVISHTKDTLDLGQILDYVLDSSCRSKAIVVSKSGPTSRPPRVSLTETLKTSIISLQQQWRHALRPSSVAIPLGLYGVEEEVVEACHSSIFSFLPDLLKSGFDIYLFCTQGTEAKSAQLIDDQFQKNGPGYFRDIHVDNISLKNARHKITVKAEVDSLVNRNADVLVCTVNPNLNLKRGMLSRQILEKAGEEIQMFCNTQFRSGIEIGGIAVADPGKLKKNSVKKIFLCALPEFNKIAAMKNVKSMVRKCFLEMDMLDLRTVAFPAFGTGTLGYPARETSKAMFDAVEDYKKTSINSSVKEVTFALYKNDNDTCQAFCDEELRRKVKPVVAKEKQGFINLFTDVGVGKGKMTVNVAIETNLVHLPSYVVIIDFKFQTGAQSPKLKRSSEQPKTWNDQLTLYLQNRDDLSFFTTAIVSLMEYCNTKKISEVLIPTNNGVIGTTIEQVDVITKVIETCKTDDMCLRKVHISVPTSEKLDEIEMHLNGEVKATRSIGIHGKLLWRLQTHEHLVEVDVVGKTRESVQQAVFKLKTYIYALHDGQQTPQVKDIQDVGKETLTHDSHTADNDVVSAEINPGIVKYLQHLNVFDKWKQEMFITHKLEIYQSGKGVVVVKGSFPSLLEFEANLNDTYGNKQSSYLQHDASNGKQDPTFTRRKETIPYLPRNENVSANHVSNKGNNNGYNENIRR